MDSMALGLLSRRESRKNLWARLMTLLLLLYFMLLLSLLMLQDAWSCLKMPVFDRLGFALLFWHYAVQSTDTTHFIDTDAYVV